MTQSASPPRRNVPPISRLSGAVSSTLSGVDVAALSKPLLSGQREAKWRPGLAYQPLHSEIFASARDASGAGLALALARDALSFSGAVAGESKDALTEAEDLRQVLWVQDKRAIAMNGRPYLLGLPEEWRERLICVEASTPEDALFALEEGLKCRDLMCVIGEIAGNPRALDFTASRRLSLTSEKHGVALWLVRLEAEADLSSARMRWRASPAVSPEPCWNAAAPGEATWQAELFRARSHAPGEWKLRSEGGRLCVSKPPKQAAPKQPANETANETAKENGRPFEHTPNVPFKPSKRSPKVSAHNGNLVRATFGRSLAAVARG